MKNNTAALWTAGDYAGLVTALQKLATFAPSGYASWASIARDGADAARAEEGEAVKASCRGCHSQYRDRYKKELRGRPL
jgi:hypothetical protein